MTAEQFWLDVPNPTQWKNKFEFAEAYHRAQAAAQLAEKEREIAKLKWDIDQFSQMASRLRELEKVATTRAKAAEQRLQEAQAWKESQLEVTPDWQKIGELLNIGLGQSVTENIIPAIMDLLDRLRQREAELEQRWIDVSEKLPEQGQIVLIAVTPTSDKLVAMFKGKRFISQPGMWTYDPTHWQPLLSPPKEASDGH